MVAQTCEYTRTHWIVYSKRVNCMVCELYLNKAVLGLASCSPWGRKELDTTEWLNDNNKSCITKNKSKPQKAFSTQNRKYQTEVGDWCQEASGSPSAQYSTLWAESRQICKWQCCGQNEPWFKPPHSFPHSRGYNGVYIRITAYILTYLL